MAIHVDPVGREIELLRRLVRWRGRRVVEIGCGDGRLTRRLAALGARIVAIEPDAALVRAARRAARQAWTPRLARRVSFHVGKAGRLKFPPGTFDLVLFSWAL